MNVNNRFWKIVKTLKVLTFKGRFSGLAYNSIRSFFPVRRGVVFLQSHNGKAFIGNPYYIAKHLLQDSKYREFLLIIAGGKHVQVSVKGLPNHHRVKVCPVNSLKYCFWLSVSEFLVCDATFPSYFSRRKDQKFLNTWHGTPLKTLGRRIAYNPFELSSTQRTFLHATHILSPNAHTEQVLLKDYMIEHVWKGSVLRSGYPRNDVFFSRHESVAPDKVNIAFMPTWRGSHASIKTTTQRQLEGLYLLFSFLEEKLSPGVKVWVRLHPLIQDVLDLSPFSRVNEFPGHIEPYEFLSGCDALITDYSSVMFDFAISKKPIIMFTADEEEYVAERNFCLDIETLPFMRAESTDALLVEINKIKKGGFVPTSEYLEFVSKFCPFDGTGATENLCSKFFLEINQEKNIEFGNNKKNILIFTGSFLNNGVTRSLKNLLNNIDVDRYNIFLCLEKKSGENNALEYFKNLNRKINFIPIITVLSVGFIDGFWFFLRDLIKKDYSDRDLFLKRIFLQEYRRIFCESKFDAIIHFTGYEQRFALLMSVSDAKKNIYMHNDMYLEGIVRKNYDSKAINLAYKRADVVAAVREGVGTAYCKKVFDISNKLRFVPNCQSTECRQLATADPLDALSLESRELYGSQVLWALEQDNLFRFINVGRFSPEKGQVRLIEAFETVWAEEPHVQLFIVGGHGKIYKDVLSRRIKSPAANQIFVLQGSDNPFPLFSRMNALVLSSFYEGLPMVIFESLALGVPIISTDISGPLEFLKGRYGHVVENSTAGLVGGMMAAINGEIQSYSFDFEEHNRQSVEKFYSLIDD
jgi:CDP-glycerol glycerophosphotransferase